MSKKLNYGIVIPILNLEKNPYIESLLSSLEKQKILPESVHLVVGDCRQGRAINYGVSQLKEEYVGILDDDSQIDDPELFNKLGTSLTEDNSIGLVGAACEIPDFASPFQKKAMKEIPRRFFPVQKKTIDSDMVQHPCLLMSKKLFEDIGGEDEELIRGLDPVLRKKVRDAGKRVVITKDTWVYHLIPRSLSKIISMYYRNGRGSGYAQRVFPDRVLELSDGYDDGGFIEKRPFIYRVFRRLLGSLKALVTCQWIRLCTDLAYGLGVLREKVYSGASPQAPLVEKIDFELKQRTSINIHIHRVKLAQ